MATRLEEMELEDRIECFGEFDRTDAVCLAQCSLNFECAAAREQNDSLLWHDESLQYLGCPHSA